jgi:non-specific serine/threonine protein kinase
MANKQIARSLGISPKTVEGHITRLMAKLGATSRVQIATWAP